MKKMVIVFTMFLLAVGLFAFEPHHENDTILKDANKKYAVVVITFNDKTRSIEPCFDSLFSYYFHKNKGDDDEKWCDENIPFYKETATPEEYLSKVYKYLSEVPGYIRFIQMTEKELAKACDFEYKNKPWCIEYSNMTVYGSGKGDFVIMNK